MRKLLLSAGGLLLAGAGTMLVHAQTPEPPAPPPPPAAEPMPAMPPMPPHVMVMREKMPKTRAEVIARSKEHFALLDKNKDGFVTRDELPSRPPMPPMPPHPGGPMGPGGPGPEALDHMFAMMDTDHNGQISKAEFEAAHKRPMHSVEMMKDKDGKEIRRERVIVMRHDGDGPPPPPPGIGPGPMGMGMGMEHMAGMMLAMRFDALDTNHDGKLSPSEIEAGALARFDKADTDHDGTLSAAEIEAARPRFAMRMEHRMQMRMHDGRPPQRGPGYDLPDAPPAPPQKM